MIDTSSEGEKAERNFQCGNVGNLCCDPINKRTTETEMGLGQKKGGSLEGPRRGWVRSPLI